MDDLVKSQEIHKIVFGLGNPGFWYRNTRHNVGFRTAAAFAGLKHWKINQKKFSSLFVLKKENRFNVIVSLPQTYMNNSGEAVESLLKKYPTFAENMLVVVDDFNLPLGAIRFRRRGSDGGHNGLQSICERIGNEYCRLRLGIGPKPTEKDVVSFVLGKWRWREKRKAKEMIASAAKAINVFIEKGIEKAMQEYN